LFPSATTLWQSWRVVPPQSRLRVTDAWPPSGHGGLRTRGSIVCAVGEDRPGDARMFGGQRNRGDIHVSTLLQSSRPGTLGVRFLVDDAQVCPSAVHQERSQVPIALAGDLPEPLFAAARVLSGGDPEGGGVAAPALEDVRIAH